MPVEDHTGSGSGASLVTRSPMVYNQALDAQMTAAPMKSSMSGGWVKASKIEVDKYLHPNSYVTGDARFQHLKLSSNPGVTASQLNKYLAGKGVLAGQGAAFIEGGNKYGVNPIYLAVHANLETGGGTSRLAKGTVSGYGGYYNLYGIGANDGNALNGGGAYAKKSGWNSVAKGIIGGAKFVGESFISKGQDTLYKMRWNPASPGNHQYATDIGWAVKQSGSIASVYKQYFSSTPVILDMPVYDGQGTGSSETNDALGPKIIEEAKKHIGIPYVMGGNGPDTFDCSGFTKFVYSKVAKLDFPRTADTQVNLGTPVNIQDLKAGDLIFWENTYKPGVSHVAISMGDGNFIGAQGDKVGIVSMEVSYWKSRYHSSRRVLSEADLVGGGGGTSGGVPGYTPVVNDDTPTGLAGGLPLSTVNSYQAELEDALERIKKANITHGVITDLKNGGSVHFYLPDDISDASAVSWEDVAILGRSVPVKGYENSGPRTIGFELELFAGAEIAPQGDSLARLEKDVRFLQSMTYPDYSNSFVLPPAVALLSLGNILKLKVVITDVSVTWKKPYTTDGRPMRAAISLEFQAVSDFPPDYYDIRNGNRNSIG